jgi:predicted membrane channel-forming protein YqfA (hemolysin III family)
MRLCTIIGLAWLLVFLQPAYANGEHVHVGGIFLVLLGGVVFLSSVGVVFYFLLRSPSDEPENEEDNDESW